MSSQYTNWVQQINNKPLRVSDRVITPEGEGFVAEIDPVFEVVHVNLGGYVSMFTPDQVQHWTPPKPANACECGAWATSNPNLHSSWCAAFRS